MALREDRQAWARPGERPPALDVALVDRPLDVGPLRPGQLAHSPSIVAYGEGALLAYRIDAFTQDDPVPDSRIALVALDATFGRYGEPTVLDLRLTPEESHTAQDPRLLWLGEELLLVFSQEIAASPSPVRRVHVARLRAGPGEPGSPLPVTVERLARVQPPAGLKLSRVERPWTPFVYEGLLWFLARHDPPLALGVDAASLIAGGPVLDTFGPIADAPAVPAGNAIWRGGTPAVVGPDGSYEAFVHWPERIGPKTYSSLGYVTVEAAPPFAIEALVPRPLVVPNLEDDSTATVSEALPGGFLRRGDFIYLAYGRHGRAVHLLTLHARALARQLVPARGNEAPR